MDNFDVEEQVYILTNICYDAEDAVKEMEFDSMMSMSGPITCTTGASARISLSLYNKIRDLSKKLEDTVQNLQRLMAAIIPNRFAPNDRDDIFSFPPSPDLLIGREGDVVALVRDLTSPDRNNTLGLTILGMNGIGKSALAYEIHNHAAVRANYPLRLWISLSGRFDPQEIKKKLVNAYIRSSNRQLDHNQVSKELSNILQKWKWLIVLDNLLDVSSSDEWFYFWSSVHRSPQQGKLIITTLNRDVAHATNTSIHFLNPLPIALCEELISRTLKNSWDAHDVNIIARMCHGFPRVAKILVHHLNSQMAAGQVDQLENIFTDTDLWRIQGFRDFFTSALETSYSMLEPLFVKKCFAYFSLFPPGHPFQREDLIQLWIGEEFLQSLTRSSPETTGKDYFRVLWKWSILQPSHNTGDEQQMYELHKFIHMFAELIASKTYLRLNEDMETRPWDISIRHLSLSCQVLQQTSWNNILTLRGLRTFLPLCEINIGRNNLQSLLHKLVYIRVLSLSGSDIETLSESIKMLKLLRYLDISKTRIKRVPNSVCQLQNLRVLKLKGCPYLTLVSHNLKNLIGLRHIDWSLDDIKRLESLPLGIGNLTCLQMLPLFTVGKIEGHRITELKNMNRLRGSICIQNLENIQDEKEATAANLPSKTSIERLELHTSMRKEVGRDVFTALEPPKFVKELRVTNYGDHGFPEWISLLYKLEALYIERWQCLELSSAYLKFPLGLKSLILKDLPKLRRWRALEAMDAPNLCQLVIKECPDLVSFPSLEHLISLRDLEISECNALDVLPTLSPLLQKFTITNCELLKDQCKPKGKEWPKIKHIQTLVVDGDYISASDDRTNEEENSDKKTRSRSVWRTFSKYLSFKIRDTN